VRRDELQARLRELVIAAGEKGLGKAPRAGVMIGVPTTLTRSIAEQFVAGLFREMTLSLENIKVHHEGDVKAKMLFRKKQIGVFVIDLNFEKIVGLLRPGTPDLRFSEGRLALTLPVSVVSGSGRARIRFRWDSKGLAANLVCGDLDVTRTVTGNVVPADYKLDGSFAIAADGDLVTLRPDFKDLVVRIAAVPTEQAWSVVDDVIDDQRAGREIALNKIDVKKKLSEIVTRGFDLKMPKKFAKPIHLPAGVSESLDIQGVHLAFHVQPSTILISEERIWYGADVTLGGVTSSPP
jgi:hypothetical protein